MKSFIYIFKLVVFGLFRTNSSVARAVENIKKETIPLALFFLLFCSSAYGQDGVLSFNFFSHDGSLRSYLLYVPNAYDGQEQWPLVLSYHGGTRSGGHQIDISQMNVMADTAHFIAVYPNGKTVQIPGFGLAAGWHVPGFSSAEQDDVAFTEAILDSVAADLNIDLARVHATGWSNGGNMAFYLACALPNKIASVAGVSGDLTTQLINECQPSRPFSTLLIQGTDDFLISFSDRTPRFWATQNNCSRDSIVTELPDVVTNDNSTVTLIEFAGCEDESEVLLYRVNDGGHAWPGGPPLFGNVNMDINASSVIWNFFKRNPHPEPVTSVENVDNSPKSFQLYANYPNPFNPTTIINYYVPSAGSVELKIYNQLGQEIRTLANSIQPIGTHQVVWDGRDGHGNSVVSGLYFYRLKAGLVVETRKMILLR